ncbi:beta-1,3-galactosyltransferase 1 [Amia ocellicauda]|uniref:beta-1,3-galactosyltransferase 1 n=1 Tax=Amia ocellicauda TaxID=2972642 RepID=UPI0034646CBA
MAGRVWAPWGPCSRLHSGFKMRKASLGPVLCLGLLCVTGLALLYVEAIESWAVSLVMTGVSVESRGHGGTSRVNKTYSGPPRRQAVFLMQPSPSACSRAKPYLVNLVTTAPANQEARQAIRKSWGGETEVMGRRVMTLFLVGLTSDPGLAQQLAREFQEHRDLIQGPFSDSYANLTLKTLSLLDWAQHFCPQARFLAKVDDDVLFSPRTLLGFLHRSGVGDGDLYLGRVHLRVAPNRDSRSKHYLPSAVFASDTFPEYCSGTAYVLSRSAALKIAAAAADVGLLYPLPPEDVFVGLCARAAGLSPSHSALFSGGPNLPYSRCCYQAMVAVHHISPGQMTRLWADVRAGPPCSWLRLRASLGICKAQGLLDTILPWRGGE